ncbi:hypothetical protein LOTGIDRAFT_164626 [Lottia gigantea]|uniref:C3H1-type domain-containing protein n=1 Tax=Lottia gigantea TaxID=225164 RepID=V4BM39_LOTGI|nr:hypothetical protein LOTGIDRAFT_164626 [Lottia gigantea]ESO89929.1 hypothetical protein LOTGIDRAFT_164626 [Lottia gigantea]
MDKEHNLPSTSKGQGKSKESKSKEIPMTTAEDRLTDILKKKLVDRGLVGHPERLASMFPDSAASKESSDSPSETTTVKETATVPDKSVFSVNATALFKPQDNTSTSQSIGSASISMSLSRHVSEKLKQDIWINKYVDLSALLPGAVPTQLSLNISEADTDPVLKLTSTSKPRVLNLELWQQAFAIFMDIVLQKSPQLASSLLVYNNLISELARLYGAKAFAYYDSQFRLSRQTSNYPWDQIHPEFRLRATTLYGSHIQKTPSINRNKGNGNQVANVCWGFNTRLGCKRQLCRFAHTCSKCGYKHPVYRCYAKVRKVDTESLSQDTGVQSLNPSASIFPVPYSPDTTVPASNASSSQPTQQASRYSFRKTGSATTKSANTPVSK